MTRIAVRRGPAPDPLDLPRTAGIIALGAAAGTLAGFLLGELWGPSATAAFRPTPAPGRASLAELVHAAHDALLQDTELTSCRLEVVPVGRGALELHGWVPSRAARARALRLARAAVAECRLVDCLLVRGEDDLTSALADVDAASA